MDSERSNKIEYLFYRYSDGSITKEEMESLNSLMESDYVKDKYFEFLKTEIALSHCFQENIALDDNSLQSEKSSLELMDSNTSLRGVSLQTILEGTDDKPEGTDITQDMLELLELEKTSPTIEIPKKRPVRELIQKVDYSNIPSPRGLGPSKFQFFATLAVAACLIVIVGFAYLMPNSISKPVVAELTDSIDAVWAKKSILPQDSDEMVQGRYRLKKGYASITFTGGAEITVEAPAELYLISGGEMELFAGRIYATIPERAYGFIVKAGDSKIVDLGTEFGVEVDESKDIQLHVTKGKTILITGSLEGEKKQFNVNEGQAKKSYKNGTVEDIHVDSDKFIREINSETSVIWNGITNIAQSEEGLIFAESFENPVVDGFAPGIVPKGWIGANEGYGAFRRGLYNSNSTDKFSTPYGRQGYLLDYTNSGLVTTETAIQEVLTAGVTYAVTFKAARSGQVGKYLNEDELEQTNNSKPHVANLNPLNERESKYRVELVAFAPGENRGDFRYKQMSGKILASATGIIVSKDMTAADSIVFTAKPDNPNLGKNIAIRLVKSYGSVIYDNINLKVWRSKSKSK